MNIEELNQVKKSAQLLYDKKTIDASIHRVATKITRDYREKNPVFLVVMNGGLIFSGKLLPLLDFPAQVDYCHATRYRGETQGGDIEWKVNPSIDLSGRHVVIVDDILDEGYTLQAIIDDCLKNNVASVKTLVLIEKLHQRKVYSNMRADYCELTTPDEYIFGLGMDYNHYWRNCDEIYLLGDQDKAEQYQSQGGCEQIVPYTALNKVTILMAMQAEAQPIIDSLQLQENTHALRAELPMRCYQKQVGTIQLSIVVAGIDERHGVDNIGSEAATLMAYEVITQLKPSLLISAGTAGGFAKRGASIGTIYVSEEHFVYHDRHVPLDGFQQSSVGKYPAAKVSRLAKNLHLKTGVISTGSSLEKSDKDIIVIDAHDAVAKEMEAAGIAWVAMLFKVPMMALKSITNLLDEDNQSEQEFVNNLDYASQCLHDKILQMIDYLQNKSLEDLA